MITQNLINCMYLVGLTNEAPNVRKIDGSSAKINYYYNSGSLATVRLQTVESKKDQTYVNTILTTDTTNWDICTFGFGTGNASPTLQDYSLENAIIDDVFEYQTSGYKLNTDYSFVQSAMTATYRYTGSNTITISEVGLFDKMLSSDRLPHSFMLAREVLETPITVSNGDVFTVTMVLS